MTNLEKRFFSKKRLTLIKPDDEKAIMFLKILKKAITKKPSNTRGRPNNWGINFDAIYS